MNEIESDELTTGEPSDEFVGQSSPVVEEEEIVGKPRSIWVTSSQWEKLRIARDELGSWGLMADVIVEQLLATGLISAEAREKIREINRINNIEELADSNWRDSFQIKEPWSESATAQVRMVEELVKIRMGLEELNQTVEDHAFCMLDAELVHPETSTEDPS